MTNVLRGLVLSDRTTIAGSSGPDLMTGSAAMMMTISSLYNRAETHHISH